MIVGTRTKSEVKAVAKESTVAVEGTSVVAAVARATTVGVSTEVVRGVGRLSPMRVVVVNR